MNVQEAVTYMKEKIEKVEALEPIFRDVQEALEELGWNTDVDVYPNSPYVCVFYPLNHIDQLTDFARVMVKRGYHLTRTQDQSETQMIVKTYAGGKIKLFASFYGGACKYVKVNEKTVPIFELQCEGS